MSADREPAPGTEISDEQLIDCLSCPFCGSLELRIINLCTEEVANGYAVGCDGCKAEGPIKTDVLEAQQAWNGSKPRV